MAHEAHKITGSELSRAGLFKNSGSSHDQPQFASMMVKTLQNVTILEITQIHKHHQRTENEHRIGLKVTTQQSHELVPRWVSYTVRKELPTRLIPLYCDTYSLLQNSRAGVQQSNFVLRPTARCPLFFHSFFLINMSECFTLEH